MSEVSELDGDEVDVTSEWVGTGAVIERSNSYVSIEHKVVVVCATSMNHRRPWSMGLRRSSIPKRVRCPHCGRKAYLEVTGLVPGDSAYFEAS